MISSMGFNSKSDKLLVCSSNCKAKLLSKDGKEIIEFMKGDMYLRDLLYTKGHTFAITDCQFHHTDDNICYTSSKDGTIRIWDFTVRPFGVERQLPNKTVIKVKSSIGKKNPINKFLLS